LRSRRLPASDICGVPLTDSIDAMRLDRQTRMIAGPGIVYSLPQIPARLANVESSGRGAWISLN
jgi:hypothetical protein